MARSPLFTDTYRPQFSGHETFPLRYGWLQKAHDAVAAETGESRQVFQGEDAIARFGVGKNMVVAIRHWATVCGVIGEDAATGQLRPTPLGSLLFGQRGVDRYLEHPGSLWLLHWQLCTNADRATTWFWSFSHFNRMSFRRDELVHGLLKLAESRGWQRVSRTTVQRDVECFVRMYDSSPSSSKLGAEDAIESPLAELGLIRGLRGQFQFIREARTTLPDEVLAYALDRFWEADGQTRTLPFERVAYDPGSPGRIFCLDETELATRLANLEQVTRGVFRWSETAGLKQVIRTRELRRTETLGLMAAGCGAEVREAA